MSAQAAATRNLTAAQQALTATGKGLGGALGFVGGPLGLLTLGLSAGVGVFLDYQQKQNPLDKSCYLLPIRLT